MLRSLFHSFGGVIVYWAMLLVFGLNPAIAAGLLFIGVEGGWRLLTHRRFPPVCLVANGLVLVFGTIDLSKQTPFMIKYESSITSVILATVFAVSAFSREPLVMSFARQQNGNIAERPEVVRYFRAFTLAWSLYYLLRAGVFVEITMHLPLAQALAIRSLFGWLTLGAMLLISMNGRWLFKLCQTGGLFRPRG